MKPFLTLLTLTILLLLSACSLNNVFLHPTKLPPIPANKEKVSITTKSKKDTTLVEFNTKTLQPTFLKLNKDTLPLNFTIESVLFKSSSGTMINGWMLKPKNQEPSITLLHFHGNAGFLVSQYQAISPLLEHGFQIFVFDYSGFGFSYGKATRDNVLMDGLSAIDYLKTREDVKNTKLVIYGQSLGGHLSAVVAQQKEKEINGLVIEGAFSSHKDIAAKRAGFIGRWLVKEKYSASQSIQNYHKPLLLIHSSEDETIPFALGQKLFSKANSPKEFYEIKKAHICGPEYYASSIAEKIKQILN